MPGRGCYHLLRLASPPPAVSLRGNQLRKGQGTYRVTAGVDGANKYWKSILMGPFYFAGTRGKAVRGGNDHGRVVSRVDGKPLQYHGLLN